MNGAGTDRPAIAHGIFKGYATITGLSTPAGQRFITALRALDTLGGNLQ